MERTPQEATRYIHERKKPEKKVQFDKPSSSSSPGKSSMAVDGHRKVAVAQ